MKQNSQRVLYILIPLLGTYLIAQDDLLIGNISGLTANPKFYFATLAFYILMGYCFFLTIRKVSKSKIASWGFVGIVISILIPYSFTNHLQAFAHITCAYLGFGIFTLVLFKTINDFKIYHYGLARHLLNFFVVILLVIMALCLKFMVINGLIEIIYLWGIDIILGIIEEKAN